MRAQDPLKPSPNPLNRSARPFVAHIRVKAHPKYFPRLKRERQHQQLRFGIGRRPYRRSRQPCVPDLASIRSAAPMQRMPLGPGPAIEIEEARRSKHDSVCSAHCGKRHCRALIPPGQCRLDILRGLILPLRNRTPPIQLRVPRRSRRQPLHMAVTQRFETNMLTGQFNRLHFHADQYPTPPPKETIHQAVQLRHTSSQRASCPTFRAFRAATATKSPRNYPLKDPNKKAPGQARGKLLKKHALTAPSPD
jgi:hypothetical protein